jgi:hypothetical protein
MTRHHDGANRSTFLSVLLGTLVAAAAMFGFFLVCGGAGLYFLAAVAGLVLLGFVHYILWGQRFDEALAAERDAIDIDALADEITSSRRDGEPRSDL